MGAPPIADVVPMIPDAVPAPNRFIGFNWSFSPEMLIITASSIIDPKSSETFFLGTTVRRREPIIAPIILPATAHLISFARMVCRSLQAMRRVRQSADNKTGPGTKIGFNMTNKGTPMSPRPNPIEPCSAAPQVVMRKAKIDSTRVKGKSIILRKHNFYQI